MKKIETIFTCDLCATQERDELPAGVSKGWVPEGWVHMVGNEPHGKHENHVCGGCAQRVARAYNSSLAPAPMRCPAPAPGHLGD